MGSKSTRSGYYDATLKQVARRWANNLLRRARTEGKVSAFSVQTMQLKVYMTAQGGPGADASFLLDADGEVLQGWYTYVEMGGRVRIDLPLPDAMVLFEAFENAD